MGTCKEIMYFTMSIITYHNRTEHFNDEGYFHRIDGPAIEYTNGSKYWFLNGKPHRLDGPAIESSSDEYHEYFINGVEYSFEEWDRLRKLLILI